MWSCDPSLLTLAFLERSYWNLNFIRIWPKKKQFFEGCSCFKFNNLGLTLGMTMKFYMSFVKGLKLKVRNVDGQFLRLWKLQEKNCLGGGGGAFLPLPPFWIVVHELSGQNKWLWLRRGDKTSHGFLISIMSLVYRTGHYLG